jgi:hypothetical protein
VSSGAPVPIGGEVTTTTSCARSAVSALEQGSAVDGCP